MGESFQWRILLPGIPASSSRGFLGWCSVALLKFKSTKGSQYALFDTGHVGDRGQLLVALDKMGIGMNKISILILSHLHYDHVLNSELFKSARIYVSAKELDYFRTAANGDVYYPNSYLEHFLLARKNDIISFEDEDELLSGRFLLLPGHTAGSSGFLCGDVLFAGDSIKYASEAVKKKVTYAYYSQEKAESSLRRITQVAKIVVPGHDAPFAIKDDEVSYTERNTAYLEVQELRGNDVKIKRI
ncbi:MAG: MBL fold metallo-hydrolase [Conexivisphaerales archaeon]